VAVPPPDAGGGGGGGKGKVAIAVVAATAVLAAAAVTGAYVLRDGGDDANAGGGGERTASPTASPTEDGDGLDPDDPDDPRQSVAQIPDPVVAPDWQVQTIENRHNAFDVPPDWTLETESTTIGYEDERPGAEPGDTAIAMSAPAVYMDGWCPEAEYGSSRAIAGTKGGQGATGTAEAARNEAGSWAIFAYDQQDRARLRVSQAKSFESDHGITGHTATATITDIPPDPNDPCPPTTSAKVVTVSYLDLNNDLATWVLVYDTGFDKELDQETVESMMNSLRPFPQEEPAE
jgi:hypothetical protein